MPREPAVSPAQSPYEAALGDAMHDLHPRLRAYFGAIPDGMRGVGHGRFDTVGTPRRWVRVLLRVFVDDDVVFPVWQHDVPFTVVNTPATAAGRPAVVGERTFHLTGGHRVMRDVITLTPRDFVDILGLRRRFRARFAARVVDGGLLLRSTRVEVRLLRWFVPVPGILAPRVELSERYLTTEQKQRVDVVLHHAIFGTLYEYSGTFEYELRAS